MEAAGVEQPPLPQSKQLIDSEKFKSVMISIIFKSWHNPVTNGHKSGSYALLRTSILPNSVFTIRAL